MSIMSLAQIRIILVEPAGPLNVGSVARVMKNMGLQKLILVSPHCDPLGEEARLMAVHGLNILEQVQQVGSLPEALQGCQQTIATTARTRSFPTPLETPRQALPWLLTSNLPSALIFGPEDRGLSNEELNYAQRFLCIPASPAYPSLNLAQSVAICAYELYQAAQIPLEFSSISLTKLASFDVLEGYYQHLETILLKMGYLFPHTAKAKMEKLRRLYNRSNLSAEEVALLRGILGQINSIWQHLPDNYSRKS
ncbi:RNA methyltransferase [cyanobacterium endosymbiont of Rhopalodia gibberula]|uniref:RNA methyltransferase n=1 Tax=cyanobacterium endosymbiont of Rhopalodia gibberula TaxID=1763363 RepID=UPI001E3543AD|nr:RNA methyltransferase [cyanobacterium endosymbiont of Rhopalodia gibberula]